MQQEPPQARLNPVDEHRRRVMIQTIVLALLTLIAAFLVYEALTMPA